MVVILNHVRHTAAVKICFIVSYINLSMADTRQKYSYKTTTYKVALQVQERAHLGLWSTVNEP